MQERARAEIRRLEGTIARNALFIHQLELAESGITSIQNSMDAALPSIQKIRGTWEAIAFDFKKLMEKIATTGEDLDIFPELMKADIDIDIDAWAALAKRADEYRTNAYITVGTRAAA
jgi:hypothetical protein